MNIRIALMTAEVVVSEKQLRFETLGYGVELKDSQNTTTIIPWHAIRKITIEESS